MEKNSVELHDIELGQIIVKTDPTFLGNSSTLIT